MLKLQAFRDNSLDGGTRKLIMIVGFSLGILAVFFLLRKIVEFGIWPDGTDISVYLTAARGVLLDETPYKFSVQYQDPYPYPPLFAELIALLTKALGFGTAWIFWVLAGLLAFLSAILVMARGFQPKLPIEYTVLLCGVFLMSHIARTDLFHGQANFLLILLIVVALWFWSTGKPTAASLLWSVAIVVKPFLGLIVIFIARKGDYRTAVLTFISSGIIFVLSFVLVFSHPIDVLSDWMAASHWHTSLPNVAKPDNQTFYGFFVRLFSESPFGVPVAVNKYAPPLLMLPVIGAAVALFLAGVAPAQKPERSNAVSLLEMGITLALFMAAGPLMEGDHFFLLLPGFFGAILVCLDRRVERRWVIACALWAAAFANLFLPFALNQFTPQFWPPLHGLMHLRGVHYGLFFFVAAGYSAALLFLDRTSTAQILTARASV